MARKRRRKRKNDVDQIARSAEALTLDEPSQGCQIFRGKLLCRRPIFVVLEGYPLPRGRGELGKVGICFECWERAIDIATDAQVDTTETRGRYEKKVAALRGKPGR